MSKLTLQLKEEDYKHIRSWLIPHIDSYEEIRNLTMIMNITTRDKMSFHLKAPICDYLFGAEVKLANIKDNIIIFVYNNSKNPFLNKLKVGSLVTSYPRENSNLPDKYIINSNACILFYGDNKIIVKRARGDLMDPVKGFLWAYFLHNTGMSRTKANKYLFKVWKTYQEEKYKK